MQLNIEALARVRAQLRDDALVTAFLRVLSRYAEEKRPLNRDDLAAIGRELGICEEKLVEAGLVKKDDRGRYEPVELTKYVIH